MPVCTADPSWGYGCSDSFCLVAGLCLLVMAGNVARSSAFLPEFWTLALLSRCSRGLSLFWWSVLLCLCVRQTLPGAMAVQIRSDITGRLSGIADVGRCSDVEPVPRRPIPTPCRAAPLMYDGLLAATPHVTSPASDLHQWACDGPTLLEESVWGAASEAFFNASTLLAVLDEHFHARSWPVLRSPEAVCLDDPNEPATCLALDMLLPEEKTDAPGAAAAVEIFDLDAGQCAIPVSDELWWDLCQFVPTSALPRTASGLFKPWRFADWVSSGITHVSSEAAFLCVTADGSFDPASGEAGWGVVFSLIDATGSLPGLYLGHFCGRTADVWSLGTDDNAPVNAFASELVGLVWAAVACFQLRIHLPLLFRCDNQAALGIAAGRAAGQTHAVCRACQGLHLGLRFSCASAPSYQHVHGHSGDPANELADALAARALSAWIGGAGSRIQGLPSNGCHTFVGAGCFPTALLALRTGLSPGIDKNPFRVLLPMLSWPRSYEHFLQTCAHLRVPPQVSRRMSNWVLSPITLFRWRTLLPLTRVSDWGSMTALAVLLCWTVAFMLMESSLPDCRRPVLLKVRFAAPGFNDIVLVA